jgi:membrane protein
MIAIPIVHDVPELVADALPEGLAVLNALYWPTLILVSIVFLTTLYHLSVPVRTSWRSDLPGAALALLIWILGALALRWTLSTAIGGGSLYGPLTAPIAVLLWLYVTALAVLIGAALNAEIDRLYPRERRGSATETS